MAWGYVFWEKISPGAVCLSSEYCISFGCLRGEGPEGSLKALPCKGSPKGSLSTALPPPPPCTLAARGQPGADGVQELCELGSQAWLHC